MIGTRRLSLLPCSEADLEDLHTLWTDHEVRRWFWDGRVVSLREVEEAVAASRHSFTESDVGIWLVFLRGTRQFVGVAGLLVESHPFFDSEIAGFGAPGAEP